MARSVYFPVWVGLGGVLIGAVSGLAIFVADPPSGSPILGAGLFGVVIGMLIVVVAFIMAFKLWVLQHTKRHL